MDDAKENSKIWDCKHPQTEVRKLVCSNGRIQCKRQCLVCGETFNPIAYNKIPININDLPDVDKQLRDTWFKDRRATMQEKRGDDKLEWLQQHNAYLRTPRWKAKRAAVLKRDGYMCQACLARSATQVHHLTYKHWRDEPLFELVSICKPCHEKITAMDNGQYTTDADMDHVLYAEIEF